jgi:hypothetical protein
MATLTIAEAARVTGVSRSQLYRYLRAGKLSRTPEGLIDTTELLRAGLLRHVPSGVPSAVPPVSAPVPMARDATNPAVPSVPAGVSAVPSANTATLERLIEVLQRELAAAREREALLTQMMHQRETQLTQAAHERETQLLQLMAQVTQQNQRLLDMPRTPPPPPGPSPAPVPHPAPQREPRQAAAPTGDARGDMRRRIVALLQGHREGLTPAEIRGFLGADRPLGDTLLGIRRYGLVQRVERGRYVATEPLKHDQS